jgi:hypothetical protein
VIRSRFFSLRRRFDSVSRHSPSQPVPTFGSTPFLYILESQQHSATIEIGTRRCLNAGYPLRQLRWEASSGGLIRRDLLDSVIEITFLDKHLKLIDRDELNVLDISAGQR